MKRLCIIMLSLWSMMTCADELSNILSGRYKPTLMSAEAIDSVLQVYSSAKSKEEQPRYSLEYENKHELYRHSFEADWYVVDHLKNTRTHLSDGQVCNAVLSPNNRYVAYVREKNLYIYKLDFMTEVGITSNNGARTFIGVDGVVHRESLIFNGVSDWIYEEEFGVTQFFQFSPDSKQIAFLRLDDVDVPSFQYQMMLDSVYPSTVSIRYPKAGMRNPRISLLVYDIYHKSIKTMSLGPLDEYYIPRMRWITPPAKGKDVAEPQLIVQKINRDQTEQKVYIVNPKSTGAWLISSESSNRYFIDYSLFDQWQWLSDGRFIMLSEHRGWAQLYLCNTQGQIVRTLTPAGMDVTKVYGVDEKRQVVYFQAAPMPLVRQAYSASLWRDNVTQITTENGIHDLTFSKDMSLFIDNFNNYCIPNRYTLYEEIAGRWREKLEVMNNNVVEQRWRYSGMPNQSFFKMITERGDTLDAWMIVPNNLDTLQRYPVVIMQYSGPQSQRVLNTWRKGFGHYLASQGFIVINADPRGSGARGRAWRNETYMQLGQKEAEDQISVARYAASLPYANSSCIAMIGWSYGGYQTIRTMCHPASPITCGVAIAPVTDWRLYDSGYTERFMRRPQVNAEGYEQSNLSAMVKQLDGRLLLVHGLADDNVHAQNTFQLVDALVQAGKQFDMQVYPDDNHFLRKRANYEHLHRRILLFLEENL